MLKLFQIKTDYSSRVYGLDVFRAVAIIFVVMGHGGFMIGLALPGFPYIRLIDGVELFFVLSGFLIGAILIKIFEKNGTLSLAQITHFWKRRWFRTLPNYYLVLLLNVLFVYLGIINGDLSNFNWKFFFFLQNFNSYFTDFFWESWSLTIEEWFYILTPLTMFILYKLLNGLLNAKKMMLLMIAFFIVSPLVYRIAISPESVDPFWFDVKFRKVVLTRLDAIMFGVLFAWLKFYYPVTWKKIALPFFITGVILIYIFMHIQSLQPTGIFSKTIYFSLTGMAAAMMLPLADSKKQFSSKFGKAITHISLISYSMYLLNLGIIAEVIHKNFTPENAVSGLITYGIFWSMVVLLSTLLYKYFEKPVMDLRDKSKIKATD